MLTVSGVVQPGAVAVALAALLGASRLSMSGFGRRAFYGSSCKVL